MRSLYCQSQSLLPALLLFFLRPCPPTKHAQNELFHAPAASIRPLVRTNARSSPLRALPPSLNLVILKRVNRPSRRMETTARTTSSSIRLSSTRLGVAAAL